MESAEQLSEHIGSEFDNALLRLRNYAYLLGLGHNQPEINTNILKGMEENAMFDAIRFTNDEGLNLASNGQTNDSSDRNYFANGMRGESGIEMTKSRLTGQMMTVFYAPIEYDEEIIGMLLGLYFAEDYLRDMLTISYFGESADSFLCTRDGKVISSSISGSYDVFLPDMLRDTGSIDEKTAGVVQAAFKKDEVKEGILCTSGSRLDNLCVYQIPSSDYILVQAFPKSVTQAMIREANYTGIILQIDWQMPDMSGIETSRNIRNVVGEDAPIIILTAYDWTDIEAEAKQAGVTAFCAKPLFMSDLKYALLSANNMIEKEVKNFWTDADFSGKRILLVEDNELNREIAETILEETGFTVETAPDGTDAVEMVSRAEEYFYDAILMDVQMPIMDGYEATRIIRALPRRDTKNLPIIAMTANAMEEDKENALKSGMNDHVAKPLDMKLFLKILGEHLT